MPWFQPTRAPQGRLARLGVVLAADDGAAGLARLCDRAGIDVVWLMDRNGLGRDAAAGSIGALAEGLAGQLERASLGLGPGPNDERGSLLAGSGVAALLADGRLEIMGSIEHREASAEPDDPRPRLSSVLHDLTDIPEALRLADDLVLPAWRFPDLETAADEVRAEAVDLGRDPATLGVAVLVPVSIGRTQAEADARVAADPIFERIGDPASNGIFGTLEECQDRVIALAHSGITDLRCIVPATVDIHDVIAQLTAITVGTTDVLIPGSLRSPAPAPPDGWGGRPPTPLGPQVSGGSKRR